MQIKKNCNRGTALEQQKHLLFIFDRNIDAAENYKYMCSVCIVSFASQ